METEDRVRETTRLLDEPLLPYSKFLLFLELGFHVITFCRAVERSSTKVLS